MIKQEILILLSSIFILVFVWIGFNIYHNSTTASIAPREKNQVIPINPKFNIQVIKELKKREKVEPLYYDSFENLSLSPTPSVSLINISSTPSPKASGGGRIKQ